ncbi:cbb3-type cytochrome c oxidase subunit II, partial [Streptococcus pneumoniae]|uniref:cbb3-type cytochrome c oxidase subunit II n=1 Tax=Streptococcus pneumoniae TaxID=1313 RepID=UPI001E3E0227
MWGSKRTGPDLSRGGVKTNPNTYKDEGWHWNHMNNPRDVNPQSIMPAYPWLCDIDREMDLSTLKQKINAMRT